MDDFDDIDNRVTIPTSTDTAIITKEILCINFQLFHNS